MPQRMRLAGCDGLRDHVSLQGVESGMADGEKFQNVAAGQDTASSMAQEGVRGFLPRRRRTSTGCSWPTAATR